MRSHCSRTPRSSPSAHGRQRSPVAIAPPQVAQNAPPAARWALRRRSTTARKRATASSALTGFPAGSAPATALRTNRRPPAPRAARIVPMRKRSRSTCGTPSATTLRMISRSRNESWWLHAPDAVMTTSAEPVSATGCAARATSSPTISAHAARITVSGSPGRPALGRQPASAVPSLLSTRRSSPQKCGSAPRHRNAPASRWS